jgi:hypothetical protein
LFGLLALGESAAVHPAAAQPQRAAEADGETAGDTPRSVVLKPKTEQRTFPARSSARPMLRGAMHADSARVTRVVAPLVLGLLGGAAGLVGGGSAGAGIRRAFTDCEDQFLGCFGRAAIGALAGEALGLTLGVHAGNKWSGSFPLALLGTTGASLFGLLVAIAAEEPASLLAIPALQFSAAIPITHATQ